MLMDVDGKKTTTQDGDIIVYDEFTKIISLFRRGFNLSQFYQQKTKTIFDLPAKDDFRKIVQLIAYCAGLTAKCISSVVFQFVEEEEKKTE